MFVLKTNKDYDMCSRPDEQTLAQHVQQELHEVDGTGVVATGLPPTRKVKLTRSLINQIELHQLIQCLKNADVENAYSLSPAKEPTSGIITR